MTPDTTLFTPEMLRRIRTQSGPNAPWASMPDAFWDFIENNNQALSFSVQTNVFAAHVAGKSKADQKRQERALEALRFEGRVFNCGIGIIARTYVGGMSGTGFTGEGKNTYQKLGTPPGQYDVLAEVMERFWPDIPPLTWNNVRPLISFRSEESKPEYYRATNDFVVDKIEASALFRFLSHVNRLEPVQATQNWQDIIDPPVQSLPQASKPRRRKGP